MSLKPNEIKAKFNKASGGAESVPLKDIYKLAKEFGLETTIQELVQIQQGLRTTFGDQLENGEVRQEHWAEWFKQENGDVTYDHHNELLVRPVIEKVKHPTRNLKARSFKYGQKNTPDKEGSGAVVLNWVAGKPSESKRAGVSLVKVNRLAISEGHVTAKEVSKFLRENKTERRLQRPEIVGKKKSLRSQPTEERQYKLTQRNEKINEIIFPGSSEVRSEGFNEHFIDKSGQEKKGCNPLPRATNCSTMLRNHTRAQLDKKQNTKTLWKMKKFSSVESKIDMR
jgi:hypothetical protein